MGQELININALETPKQTLENLRIGGTAKAPHFQRASLETTRARIKNECAKRYTFSKTNEIYFRTQPEMKFKVIDIRLRKIYDKSENVDFGFDSSDCIPSLGVEKKPLFLIYITIEKV